MLPIPIENAILPRIGRLSQLAGKTILDVNKLIRPKGYELISSDRPIPKGWPKYIYKKWPDRFLINGRWHVLSTIHWYEKLEGRPWRRFYGFAVHKRIRSHESIPAFIYRREVRRKSRIIEYIPIVFIEADRRGIISKAWKTWCLRARRSKSSGEMNRQ